MNAETEISLIDILHFIKSVWKITVVFGFIGIAISLVYIATTPKQYEASVQIVMGQIASANNNNPAGVNVEEPSLLIVRLSSPTSFTPGVTAACGLQGQANAEMLLSKSIKLTLVKGVTNLVELKTFGQTPQLAQECALAVFELIKNTQSLTIAPYIEDAKVKLADDEVRLAKAKKIVSNSDSSGSLMGVVYLSTRDEIRYLLDEITLLKNIVSSSQNRATSMVAPIYSNDSPIAPKKRMVLANGLFGGLFFGLLIALVHRMTLKLKSLARSS